MKNRLRRGELIDFKDAESRFGRVVTELTTFVQGVAGAFVQSGLVSRDREVEAQAYLDTGLKRISRT